MQQSVHRHRPSIFPFHPLARRNKTVRRDGKKKQDDRGSTETRMSVGASIASSYGGAQKQPQMDRDLLQAAMSDDTASMREMAAQDRDILLGTTPQGNTCLHISSIQDHKGFCRGVVALEESLLAVVNLDGETPLLVAVKNGRMSLASVLLCWHDERGLSEAILQQDKYGFNALHHAIRNGQKDFAMELIAAEPALSQHVNKYDESPMFIAAMKDFTKVSEELLKIPDSTTTGPYGYNPLHAAVRNGNSGLAKGIMETRPLLAREPANDKSTPLSIALQRAQTEVVRVLLEHDCSLGYEVPVDGLPLLYHAAYAGHIDVAKELLRHCPDTPYRATQDACHHRTVLHIAVEQDHVEFVGFILKTEQLRKLVNMRDMNGQTALHYAVQKCNPKMVAALLSHKDIDTSVLDAKGVPPAWELLRCTKHAKTLNWNEVNMRMWGANPGDATSLHNLHTHTKQKVIEASRRQAKSLTQTYTSNTSLVAILIVTITFAAAFTLPGGYSDDAGSEGLPIMSKKFAFQAFLISDVLAMCSSFAVAFIYIVARWEDYEFLIYYRSFTRKLMWFAYVATTTAFSTALYTVLAPRLHWLAIVICVLVALLPILTKLLGEWPILKLRFKLGKDFNSDFLDMV